MSENMARREPLTPSEVAKPLYLQQIEQATDPRPFLREMERVMKSSSSDSDDSSDSDEDQSVCKAKKSKGARLVNGVMMTKEERRKDRARFYNFSNVGKEREWLKEVLLNSSESSEDESTPEGKDRRINTMLKQRRLELKYSRRFQMKKTKPNYMYYSSGLLSTIDRYVHPQRSAKPPSTSRGRRGRPPSERGGRIRSERKTRGAYKPRRGRAKEGPSTSSLDTSMQDGMLDWEEQLTRTVKVEEEENFPLFNPMSVERVEKTPGVRGRKKLSEQNTPEALTALRRRHWQLVVKKDLGKVQRSRANAHKEAILQRKRLSTACAKHWRNVASHSQKNMKETVWRCKRLSREMQTYWKRYDRAEKDARRRMEKEAEEQRKMDVELMEAKRQRRKLNFLITQTELYAHFMQRKNQSEADNGAEQILQNLDEDVEPRLAAIDTYDSEAMKAQATANAREAFRAERARTQLFDSLAGVGDVEVEVEADVEMEAEAEAKGGEQGQPEIFRGTLKGYQLKGMNWLANLYDQGISGILADEMGLGKTVQCIAFLCHVAEKLGVWGPFLVVSPASTLHNWQQEVERFAPDFKVVPYWGSPSERKILRQFWERRDVHTRQAAFHVCITSYQIVVSDMKYLNRVSWQYMILDEAQAIKSSHSMRWKQLLGFSCRNRLLLSGTPIQNSMAELWALLHFIMPTLFDSHEEFNEWFSKDIESHAENKTTMDEKHLSRLHMILKPFMLRRVKKDVENELSDKIEIMVHCPLTIRQKLLYIALKQKIRIEDLLHYSVGAETGHNIDKNFTSNLMNLVMQFRKVCNHPELFERRDVKSPYSIHLDDYFVPKIVAEECILVRSTPSNRHLLYNTLSILTPEYINESLKGVNKGFRKGMELEEVNGCFSFTRFMDLSPMEIYRIMLCGWLFAMHHIEATLEKYDRLRHRFEWWYTPHQSSIKGKKRGRDICSKQYDRARWKDMLLICPDGDVLKQRKEDSFEWSELLFTDPLWVDGGPFYTYADHTFHYMAETMEHRVMRARHLKTSDNQMWGMDIDQPSTSSAPSASELAAPAEPIEEFPHVERDPIVFQMMPTPLPQWLYAAQPKAIAPTLAPFACSRSFAYHETRHQHAESAAGSQTLARLAARSRPACGWAPIKVPDKNQLVSDAGKLTVLDSLLKKLKQSGHRVLIYSQMTKMIDLLEEYMWHRKHKYMRLDGSSKISARRDMVADFQARTDIFVFLLSTRAGGLGINLTAADTVIFYDSDWNPTVDQQAMDRAHRLGQTKQVTVYRLICQGTIEERIMERAREKSEIQRMVISGGNFKVDSLKPKEVVSLLLDDEEIELKYRQKSEEKKREERERKRKIGLPAAQPAAISTPESKRSRDSSEPASPLQIDDDEDNIVVDAPAASTSFAPVSRVPSWGVTRRGVRGARRGRPRGSRHAFSRRGEPVTSADAATALAAGALLLESDAPLESSPSEPPLRGRRGRGRPRGATPRAAPSRRPRRPREPLLVPLAPPPE